jgi:hypothetical protein
MMARIPPALALLLIPSAAAAQTAQADAPRIALVGEAPSACVIRSAGSSSGVNATVESVGSSASRIRIVQMVDTATAQPNAASIAIALPVICNSAHRILVRSGNGGMLRDGAGGSGPSTGFSEFQPYGVEVAWAGQDIRRPSNEEGGLVLESASGQAGQVAITIELPAGTMPLVAGTYSDAIVIEFLVAS